MTDLEPGNRVRLNCPEDDSYHGREGKVLNVFLRVLSNTPSLSGWWVDVHLDDAPANVHRQLLAKYLERIS